MMPLRSVAAFAVALGFCYHRGAAQVSPSCTGDGLLIGDGECTAENNNAACGYDGGDCCLCSCGGAACSFTDFDCVDPTAADEFFDCKITPPAALPCPAEVQQAWTVESTEQARALAAAVNCSGGSFEVEWRGSVVIDETIHVLDGTVLTISGADTSAVIDGNASSRLFTIVSATLHLRDVNITSGASVAGGAIAAAGSVLTLNRTNFIGNSAEAYGGAVLASNGSDVSCIKGGEFARNSAGQDGGAMHVSGGSTISFTDGGTFASNSVVAGNGGAMFVTGGSTVSFSGGGAFSNNKAHINGGGLYANGDSIVSCGGSWINNTAGTFGGALAAELASSVSWTEEAAFAFNTAGASGGALYSFNTSVSWSGATMFHSNRAADFNGGAAYVVKSTVSWSGATTFSNCTARRGGALYFYLNSRTSWSGRTEFVANSAESGGAIFTLQGSSISWTGTTEFTSNEASTDGGAVGSFALDSVTNPLDSVLVIDGSTTFSDNSCGANGGALALLGGLSLDIGAVDVTFVNNSAAVAGGAVFVSGTGVGPAFPGVMFVSNFAEVGGAVSAVGSGNLKGAADFLPPNPTTFERCIFMNNRAAATGGAIESAAGQDAFNSSVFEGNKAGTGGALRLAGTASMESCRFVENLSDDGGGAAVSNIGSMWKVENLSFSGNVFDCEPGMFLSYSEVRVGVRAGG